MKDSYIHMGDFELFVRDRFKIIIGGNGPVIPRIAIKVAIDHVFNKDCYNEYCFKNKTKVKTKSVKAPEIDFCKTCGSALGII